MKIQAGSHRRDRGAAAVEMALVLPMLLLVIGGLVDFGRLFYTQLVLSNAAREGARMVALGYPLTGSPPVANVKDRIDRAAGGVTWTYVSTPVTCSANPAPTDYGEVRLTTSPTFKWTMLNVVPQLFGGNIPAPAINARGSMRCTG